MIPESEVIKRLIFENSWWSTGKIDDIYGKMQPREYFEPFYPLVKSKIRRAVILMGPRRVGKTVMIHHSIQKLLSQKINANKIAFVSLETPLYSNISLEKIFELCRVATSQTKNLKGWYIFFDEIQYLKDWERHLASLVNSYPYCRFVVSGSAAAALKLKSDESGAGRFTNFLLPPLTFYEFVLLKDEKVKRTLNRQNDGKSWFKAFSIGIKRLNNLFVDYINFGGFPEVVFSKEAKSDQQRYVRDDIVDKVLLRDLPSLYGIKDVMELKNLFNFIAYHTASEFSLESLSKNSGTDKKTIEKYLQYLEAAFLIKRVYKISNTAKNFKRITHFKIYLTNPSMRSALFSPVGIDDKIMGHMVENAIFSQMIGRKRDNAYYARWQEGEVDFVFLDEKFKILSCAEIKWSDRYFEDPKELKSLLYFARKNNVKGAIVTALSKYGTKEVDNIKIQFQPAADYAFREGQMLLAQEIISKSAGVPDFFDNF